MSDQLCSEVFKTRAWLFALEVLSMRSRHVAFIEIPQIP